ncbi:MAG: cyclic-di-AMP receptor [Vallitaleaceae bacterium]|jgi:uncharacterized protein YaaQ|nr:cyclic-di-AMP receptor [Vallitaleaceae bacterium]
MKLIIAIIHDEDAHPLMDALSAAGYMCTKLASTGGLLRNGSTTIFLGIDADKVEDAISIIKKHCQTQKQMSIITPPSISVLESVITYPIEVTIGGATVFVLDIDQYLKL